MRIWVMLAALSITLPAAADPPASPRLAALVARPTTEAAFWKQVATDGTPLVEDVKDPKGRLLVTFVYRGKPDTKHVAVYNVPSGVPAGYAQLERLAGTSVFAYSTLVDPAARFIYFLAPGDNFGPPSRMADFQKRHGLFRPDLLNKHPHGVDGSTVELPNAPPQPTLVPKRGTPTGELVIHIVKSKALANERPVLVYTPPAWSKTAPVYPLVVMFDGPETIPNLALPVILDELIAAKKIPPVVVVLVGNADRSKELPGNPAFADFVALELVPWARATYHATSDPQRTVIAGISFGGIAAAFAALRHPGVYGNVLSQSGSYWWAADDAAEPEAHPHDYAIRPRLPLRFWLEVGAFELGAPRSSTDQVGANRHMRDVLVARGYDVTYREFAGAHEYISWRGTLADGLVALLARPPQLAKAPASPGKPAGIDVGPAKPTLIHKLQRIGLLDGGAAALAFAKQQAETLATEAEVNEAGYCLMELDRADAALPLFQWNVERFPKSSNAYDSLAQAHYQRGDRPKALAAYQKALELDPKADNAKKMIDLLR